MITFLSGGTGTLALISGVRQILHDSDIAVVASTAGDSWVSGSHSAPDIDAAVFLFAGTLDTGRWWGIRGDTYATHNYLSKVAGAEPFPIGDRARAVQIARAALLQRGLSLTGAVQAQCRALSIGATVLPVTDAEIGVLVDTGTERLPLFEYWTAAAADTEVRELVLTAPEPPAVTDEVRAVIEASDAVVIGPDNPARGILFILDCARMRDLLHDRFVVAVSPFSGDVMPDPKDAALMYAIGEKPTSPGVFRLYRDVVDVFVQDLHDPDEIPGALRLETHLLHRQQAESLAWDIMAVIRHAVS
ncbi:MAG: 2-phospho-L-lactate transferase CofD family protein [Candidatus Methanoculleus thermohydrogenotrophicum]|mgnify:FL=1|jgi:LPPG:FO 2-phospho-L-lactate transferase|nr:2-phospho-L-lactate transferase CofD family protein [Candidatus Methanoculleus thermohydrogenotrophicum]HQC91782.1 2-phospho-L-lactate transferase CofD family protein [Candidatus Methanoculleus thermohydrogenotrophicum]